MSGFTFNLDDVKSSQVGLFVKAIQTMESVVRSAYFISALEDELEISKDAEGELSEFKVLGPVGIYHKIVEEKTNLKVRTYYTSSNVYGYGLPSDDILRVNSKYTDKYNISNEHDLKALGRTILHEHTHNVGFKHDFKATARRANSLSYIVGRAFERAYDDLYTPYVLKNEKVCYRSWKTLWIKTHCYYKTVKVYI